MKLTLEKAELIQLIGKSLGYTLAEEDVVINADPFEVRIQNVNLGEMAAAKPPPDIDPGFAVDPADVGADFDDVDELTAPDDPADVMTMDDILTQNADMGGPDRPLGPNESSDPPPFSDEEMFAKR